MSTLAIRAPHLRKPSWLAGGFARALSALLIVIDVFTDAQQQAYAAKQRYPFIDW